MARLCVDLVTISILFMASLRALCIFLILFLSLFAFNASAQKILTGVIKDQHSAEPVPFASIKFAIQPSGQLSDSAGNFSIKLRNKIDTLLITSVGYQDFALPVNYDTLQGDTVVMNFALIPGKINAGVTVKSKINRGLLLWRRMVHQKPRNNPYRFQNFSYQLYNKLELDLKNVNARLGQKGFLKPFGFVFENIDTSEGEGVLPAFLSEVVSDYYYQKDPTKRREVLKAVKTIGVNNESAAKLLGGIDQVVNVYNNFIPVFDKSFVSPLSDRGDQYYHYKITDTQYVAGKRLIHFVFYAKRKGENTFEGDGWVHDSSYAIQKLSMRLGKEANVNFVDRLSLIQEYALINDSTWFLTKDKFVIDVSPLSKKALAFIGRKTTTYRNIVINNEAIHDSLQQNQRMEETVLLADASDQSPQVWSALRHEELSKREQGIYNMVDSLLALPAFRRTTRIINFIGTGYWNFKTVSIGPWQNWVSGNRIEGSRLRFDLSTNTGFNKKVMLHGYGAYGFGDKKFKGQFDAFYLIKKSPRMHVSGGFISDFDYGQSYYDEISNDNVFSQLVRKNGVPVKFIRLQQFALDGYKEWRSGFSVGLSFTHKDYDPVLNLPNKEFFTSKGKNPFTSFEAGVRIRFAYLEKFLENNFYRTSLGSPYPIGELKIAKGLGGVLAGSLDYYKMSLSISNTSKVAPLGSIYYNVFGGRTFGTLPYMYLDIAPGNELHYYNRSAFNMMNRYAYVHDRYTGLNLEHAFGAGVFRYIPLTRKLGFRQLWQAKFLWGSLSQQNRVLNFIANHPFESLNGATYLEAGTGIDNILKVFRIDFVWRILPGASIKTGTSNFGVFGSFRFSF